MTCKDEQLRHSEVFSSFLGYKINFEGFIKEGFLWKEGTFNIEHISIQHSLISISFSSLNEEGAIVKSWKKRWFVLGKEYLSYYEEVYRYLMMKR